MAQALKDLKKGEFFTLKPITYPKENQVWLRGDYDRSARAYSCIRFDDASHETLRSGGTKVYTDLVF